MVIVEFQNEPYIVVSVRPHKAIGGLMMRLKNKVILMCGVGPGMGRATAMLFAQEGAEVIINARGENNLTQTVSMINNSGGSATAVSGDMSKREEAYHVAENAINQYGRIDILYSGAGGFFEPDRVMDQIDEHFWNNAITNTLNSLYNSVHVVRPSMAKNGGGSIVAIAASQSVMQESNPAYAASKAGIIGMSKNLARKLYPDNIRINTISAGLFRAQLGEGKVTPANASLHRTGHPEDIAYTALFLASNDSNWITGQVITVDGGVDASTRNVWEYEKI